MEHKKKAEKHKVLKSSDAKRQQLPKKKKKNMQRESLAGHIHKVLKSVHADCSLSSKAINIMDGFAHDLFDRLVDEAIKLMRINKKKTLTFLEFQSACRLVLPGELAKHAVNDACKAVNNYMQEKNREALEKDLSMEDDEGEAEDDEFPDDDFGMGHPFKLEKGLKEDELEDITILDGGDEDFINTSVDDILTEEEQAMALQQSAEFDSDLYSNDEEEGAIKGGSMEDKGFRVGANFPGTTKKM